jgi:hypothetical protein
VRLPTEGVDSTESNSTTGVVGFSSLVQHRTRGWCESQHGGLTKALRGMYWGCGGGGAPHSAEHPPSQLACIRLPQDKKLLLVGRERQKAHPSGHAPTTHVLSLSHTLQPVSSSRIHVTQQAAAYIHASLIHLLGVVCLVL